MSSPTKIPIPLPQSWILILRSLAAYYVLVRPQIQQEVFPSHKSTRYCRKKLSEMCHAQLIGKSRRTITFDDQRSGCPVYFLKQKGVFELVKATRDDTYDNASVVRPREDRLDHWVATSETHRRLRLATNAQGYVTMPLFVNEWNKFRADGNDQYYLHAMLQEQPKKISCSPDGAFMLSVGGMKSVVYLESDLGTSFEAQVAARKHAGYELLAQSNQFRTRHFPEATDADFRVLMITTDRWRRDRLARHMQPHSGSQRWRFAAIQDFRPEHLLHEPIMVNAQLEPKCLVAPPNSYELQNLDVSLNQPKHDVPRHVPAT